MNEAPALYGPKNSFRPSPENMERIYRGEAACIEGKELENILSPKVLEVAAAAATGLTYEELSEDFDYSISSVRGWLHEAYSGLKVSNKAGLIPYFPIDLEDELLADKTVSDLKTPSSYTAIEIVEGLSVGLPYKIIAAGRNVTPSTLRTVVGEACKAWPDARGALGLARIANGIRARHVQLLEDRYGKKLPSKDISRLTLCEMVDIEDYRSWAASIPQTQEISALPLAGH